MKRSISLALVIIMLFSVVNVSVFAVNIATPKATASNDVGGVKVYWGKVDGAVKYNVYRRVGGSSNWVLAGTTTGTKIIDKGVSNGKYYVYSVRAYNSQNSYSAYNKDMTYTVKCVATPKLTSLVNDTKGLKLTWSAVSGASYRVYRRGAGSSTWLYLGTTNSTTFTDSKATSGAYWRYTVRAISNGYYSGFDTNGLYTIRLANPYSIKAAQSDDGVKVTWAKINGATGYRVYRRGAGQTSWTYLGATTNNTFVDTKIGYGENYYRYTVRATRGNVYSGFYSEGAVVRCVVFEPITDPLDAVKMYENYDNFGTCCKISEVLTNRKELEQYVPNDVKTFCGGVYSIYEIKCDVCKSADDMNRHANFCLDFSVPSLKNIENWYNIESKIFYHKGKMYFYYSSGKGTIYYDYDSAIVIGEGDKYVDVALKPDYAYHNDYYDLFSLKKVNGSYIVEAVEPIYINAS